MSADTPGSEWQGELSNEPRPGEHTLSLSNADWVRKWIHDLEQRIAALERLAGVTRW